MPSNIIRKELKQDKFVEEVGHSVDYLAAHRKNFTLYGGILAAVVLIAAGIYYYQSSQQSLRSQELGEAISLNSIPVSAPVQNAPVQPFATEEAKNAAITKALNKVIADFPGSNEFYVAEFMLGGIAVDANKMDEARKKYQDVADHANANYSSLAKLSLAQIDFVQNKSGEAETLLKDLMDHPTDLVSKNQATIAYAKGIGAKRPDEARKLLTPLTTPPTDISPIATAALAELPSAK